MRANETRRRRFSGQPSYSFASLLPCPSRLGHATTVRRLLQLGADPSGVGQPLAGPAPKPYCPLSAAVLTSAGNQRAMAAVPTIVKLLLVSCCPRQLACSRRCRAVVCVLHFMLQRMQ